MKSANTNIRVSKAIILLMTLLPAISKAAIIDYGSFTRDTATGLDWLDLTETRDRSHVDISQSLLPGGEFEGWRFASVNEAQTLWMNFGIPSGTTASIDVTDTANYNFFLTAVALLGDIHALATNGSQNGAVGLTSDLIDGFDNAYVAVGMFKGSLSLRTLVEPGNDGLSETTPSIYHGSYLVREVPLPAALWLFSSAFLSLRLSPLLKRK